MTSTVDHWPVQPIQKLSLTNQLCSNRLRRFKFRIALNYFQLQMNVSFYLSLSYGSLYPLQKIGHATGHGTDHSECRGSQVSETTLYRLHTAVRRCPEADSCPTGAPKQNLVVALLYQRLNLRSFTKEAKKPHTRIVRKSYIRISGQRCFIIGPQNHS